MKIQPSNPVVRLACCYTNPIHECAWQTTNHSRRSGPKPWRHRDPVCANQRRPACRWEPISAFQRAAARPMVVLHDGEEVTAYIWTEQRSFNIISQKQEYRLYEKRKRHASQRERAPVEAGNSPPLLRLRYVETLFWGIIQQRSILTLHPLQRCTSF